MSEQIYQSDIEQGPKLSFRDRLDMGMALAGSVLVLAGGIFAAKEGVFPQSAGATMTCTESTSTTTAPDGTVTETNSRYCTDEGEDSPPEDDTSQPEKPAKKPSKPSNEPDKPDKNKTKQGKTVHGPKVDQTDSQTDFPGYNMEDTDFTDSNGCFVTAEASALRRETGIAGIKPRKLNYPELRAHWGPDENGEGVHGFLFGDVLPRTAARYGVKVWDADFEDALKAIENGDQVMMLAGANSYFTDGGHYMAAWKVVNGNRLVIDDPNGKGKHGDSERARGWSGAQLAAAGVIDYRVLHLKGDKS